MNLQEEEQEIIDFLKCIVVLGLFGVLGLFAGLALILIFIVWVIVKVIQ